MIRSFPRWMILIGFSFLAPAVFSQPILDSTSITLSEENSEITTFQFNDDDTTDLRLTDPMLTDLVYEPLQKAYLTAHVDKGAQSLYHSQILLNPRKSQGRLFPYRKESIQLSLSRSFLGQDGQGGIFLAGSVQDLAALEHPQVQIHYRNHVQDRHWELILRSPRIDELIDIVWPLTPEDPGLALVRSRLFEDDLHIIPFNSQGQALEPVPLAYLGNLLDAGFYYDGQAHHLMLASEVESILGFADYTLDSRAQVLKSKIVVPVTEGLLGVIQDELDEYQADPLIIPELNQLYLPDLDKLQMQVTHNQNGLITLLLHSTQSFDYGLLLQLTSDFQPLGMYNEYFSKNGKLQLLEWNGQPLIVLAIPYNSEGRLPGLYLVSFDQDGAYRILAHYPLQGQPISQASILSQDGQLRSMLQTQDPKTAEMRYILLETDLNQLVQEPRAQAEPLESLIPD
jgi:hypothetical protein